MKPELSVIVRSSGERTEALCRAILERETGIEVEVVRERPFWRALKKSMEIGIDKRAPWTLVIDADVLLAPGALGAMAEELEDAASRNFYMLDLLLLDRCFGGPAHAGAHIYRTGLFDRAMQFIGNAADEIRPETYICQQMDRLGFPFIQSLLVTGVHDYEQSYSDLYRKNYVRSYKFRELWRYMFDRCRLQYADDEFKVILWGYLEGLRAGFEKDQRPVLDSEAYRNKSAALLEMLGIREKSDLAVTDEMLRLPQTVLEEFSPDELYSHAFTMAPYRIMHASSVHANAFA